MKLKDLLLLCATFLIGGILTLVGGIPLYTGKMPEHVTSTELWVEVLLGLIVLGAGVYLCYEARTGTCEETQS